MQNIVVSGMRERVRTKKKVKPPLWRGFFRIKGYIFSSSSVCVFSEWVFVCELKTSSCVTRVWCCMHFSFYWLYILRDANLSDYKCLMLALRVNYTHSNWLISFLYNSHFCVFVLPLFFYAHSLRSRGRFFAIINLLFN